MASTVGIVNMALTHLGHVAYIGNLTTEKSAPATIARNVYDTTLEATLRAFNWPFARTYVLPGLVTEDDNDRTSWKYLYRYPPDCIKIIRIIPDATVWTIPHIVRGTYEIASDDQGRLILTNEEEIRVEYTRKVTNATYYTPDFILALSYHLAFIMAPALTGGDPFGLGQLSFQKYQDALANAQVMSIVEQQPQNATGDETSEFTKARD